MTAVPVDDQGSSSPRPSGARAALDLLGLGARAGSLVFGTNAVRAAAREGGVYRVILAGDTAEGQRRKLIPLLDARRIPYFIGFTRAELGAATGRPPASAVGIGNRQLADRAGALLGPLSGGAGDREK